MTYLTLELLGPMQVRINGRLIAAFPYEKVRALLAYLVMESHHRHHRDQLAALLWTVRSESNGRANLRKALHMLRQVLNESVDDMPLFFTTRNTIQFNSTGNSCVLDVAVFTDIMHRHQGCFHQAGELHPEIVSDLEQSVSLYRGQFLDQMRFSDGEMFETWMMLNRQRLHQLVVQACTRLIVHYEYQRNYPKLQEYAQRQLQLEPWNEVAHRSLMRTFAQAGQRTMALQQYNRCCTILERELATEPEPATIALWHTIHSSTFSDSMDTELIDLSPTHNRGSHLILKSKESQNLVGDMV